MDEMYMFPILALNTARMKFVTQIELRRREMPEYFMCRALPCL